MLDDFVEYCRRNPYRCTDRKFSMQLPTYMPDGRGTRVEKFTTANGETSTQRVLDFPPLETARAVFAAAAGIASWAEAGGGLGLAARRLGRRGYTGYSREGR